MYYAFSPDFPESGNKMGCFILIILKSHILDINLKKEFCRLNEPVP